MMGNCEKTSKVTLWNILWLERWNNKGSNIFSSKIKVIKSLRHPQVYNELIKMVDLEYLSLAQITFKSSRIRSLNIKAKTSNCWFNIFVDVLFLPNNNCPIYLLPYIYLFEIMYRKRRWMKFSPILLKRQCFKSNLKNSIIEFHFLSIYIIDTKYHDNQIFRWFIHTTCFCVWWCRWLHAYAWDLYWYSNIMTSHPYIYPHGNSIKSKVGFVKFILKILF